MVTPLDKLEIVSVDVLNSSQVRKVRDSCELLPRNRLVGGRFPSSLAEAPFCSVRANWKASSSEVACALHRVCM